MWSEFVKQETLKASADSLNILTASTGVGTSAWGALEYWDFVNTNAAGIGVLLTLIFGVIAILFNLYNSSKLSKVDKNEEGLSILKTTMTEHIKETEASFTKVDTGISEILTKLNRRQGDVVRHND